MNSALSVKSPAPSPPRNMFMFLEKMNMFLKKMNMFSPKHSHAFQSSVNGIKTLSLLCPVSTGSC